MYAHNISTLFLTLVPFVIVGGTLLWLRRAVRLAADRREEK